MKKIKVKREDFLMMWGTLSDVGKKQRNIKGAYAIAKNIATLKPTYEEIVGTRVLLPEFLEYERERVRIAKHNARKDPSGRPILDGGNYLIDNINEFTEMIDSLKSRFEQAIMDQEELDKDYKKFLDDEIEIEIYPIIFKYLPKELDAQSMVNVMPLIDGDELIKKEVFGDK